MGVAIKALNLDVTDAGLADIILAVVAADQGADPATLRPVLPASPKAPSSAMMAGAADAAKLGSAVQPVRQRHGQVAQYRHPGQDRSRPFDGRLHDRRRPDEPDRQGQHHRLGEVTNEAGRPVAALSDYPARLERDFSARPFRGAAIDHASNSFARASLPARRQDHSSGALPEAPEVHGFSALEVKLPKPSIAFTSAISCGVRTRLRL